MTVKVGTDDADPYDAAVTAVFARDSVPAVVIVPPDSPVPATILVTDPPDAAIVIAPEELAMLMPGPAVSWLTVHPADELPMSKDPAPGTALVPVPPDVIPIGVVACSVVNAPVFGDVLPIGGGAANSTCCEIASEPGSMLTVNPSGGFVSIV